jgi:ADP-heptose:LPS heptosyltransferase
MKTTTPSDDNTYLIHNPWWVLLFRAIDRFLKILPALPPPHIPARPRRILLSNMAHLGDVLISTSVLPVIKNAYPDAEIGFIVGKWSLPVLLNHPMVDMVHIVDHWFLNRTQEGWIRKVLNHLETRNIAIREIREAGYDAAIDLYSYFPNAIPLLKKAGIPVRIGYSSGGFGSLLTNPVPFRHVGKHESEYQADLLRVLGFPEKHMGRLQMILPPPPAGAGEIALRLTGVESFDKMPYRLIHMGSGAGRTREWPLEAWRGLAKLLLSEGHLLLFTGIGARERKNAETVAAGLNGCHILCDQLGWWDFIEIIRHAEIVYSVETSAGHIAAAVGTPCVSVYGGISDNARWRPRGKYCALVKSELDCSPCYKQGGCESMKCLREIPPGELHAAGEKLLALATSSMRRRRKPAPAKFSPHR